MDLQKYNIRTDLAYEAVDRQDLQYANEVINEEVPYKNINITKTVLSENVSNEVGRKPGFYYLIDISKVDMHDTDASRDIEDSITKVLKEIGRASCRERV